MEVLEKRPRAVSKSAVVGKVVGFQAAFLTYRIEPRVMTYDHVRKRFATREHPFENHAAPYVAYSTRMKCQSPADEVYTIRIARDCYLQRIVDLLKLGL